MRSCTKCGGEVNITGCWCSDCRREYKQIPEVKKRRREYQRERSRNPEEKARARKYRNRPEVKARMRKYAKEYYSKPENKEKNREYQRKRRAEIIKPLLEERTKRIKEMNPDDLIRLVEGNDYDSL